MSEAIQLDDYVDEARSDSYSSRAVPRKPGASGGNVDDVLKRLAATIPYLATKDDLKELRGEVAAVASRIPHLATNEGLTEVRAIIPHLATGADLKGGIGFLRAEMSAMETRIIKWMVATTLTSVGLATGLAVSIAKLVH